MICGIGGMSLVSLKKPGFNLVSLSRGLHTYTQHSPPSPPAHADLGLTQTGTVVLIVLRLLRFLYPTTKTMGIQFPASRYHSAMLVEALT